MSDYQLFVRFAQQTLEKGWNNTTTQTQEQRDRAFTASMNASGLDLEKTVLILQEDCENLETELAHSRSRNSFLVGRCDTLSNELHDLRSRFFLCVAVAAIASFALGALLF